MNWKDRGQIKKGMMADIVVLDFANIETETSVSNAHRYSEGVECLIVNGNIVLEEGKFNGTLAGEVIRLTK
jgi:N-acyl-D-amino-acid deacylase